MNFWSVEEPTRAESCVTIDSASNIEEDNEITSPLTVYGADGIQKFKRTEDPKIGGGKMACASLVEFRARKRDSMEVIGKWTHQKAISV
jgi:hypothetical protein